MKQQKKWNWAQSDSLSDL